MPTVVKAPVVYASVAIVASQAIARVLVADRARPSVEVIVVVTRTAEARHLGCLSWVEGVTHALSLFAVSMAPSRVSNLPM